MKDLIIYLERKIELCTEMNMHLERWAFSDALKKAKELQLLQTDVIESVCEIQKEFSSCHLFKVQKHGCIGCKYKAKTVL